MTPEISSQREEVPLFFGVPQEVEMLINTSLRKLIKGKVFAFSSPSLNLGGDQAAGDGTVNTFPVCLSLRGILLAAGGKPSVLSRSTFQLILSQESPSSERPGGL